jgi:WD40 repeat protein
MNAPTPLADLLGARWLADAPVLDAVWSAAGECAGFALGDGTLALAAGEWDDGPQLKPHAAQGIELIPARAPPPPVTRFAVHHGVCLSLANDPDGGFLSAGDDGRLVQLAIDGSSNVLAELPGQWIDLVATSRFGLRAYASGRRIFIAGRQRCELSLPASAAALAFDAGGERLAIAHQGGVTLWSADTGASRLLAWPGLHRALAWSPDGRYVVTGLQENALHAWRLPAGDDVEMGGYALQPRALSFSADGHLLVTSGGDRPVCWRFDPPRGAPPQSCGRAGQSPVTCVACHPTLAMIAVGYHGGSVQLCQPGGNDVLVVKGSGSAPVAALAWSPDGGRLAYGTEAGEMALVYLPHALFRISNSR